MRSLTLAGVAFCLLACRAAGDELESTSIRSREQFAAVMSKIAEGMSATEVIAIIGRPDDIITEYDPGGIPTNRTKEIWRYGTSGHLTTATLGQVYIDVEERVQYVYGQGQPLSSGHFQESELRELLRVLDRLPSYNSGYTYNPRPVIQAVNLLQPLGKTRAVAAIAEYLRITSRFDDRSGREGVFLLLHVLFDVPEDPGHLPRMRVGLSWPPDPSDLRQLPRFPIVLAGDIPFLVVAGYRLEGIAEQPGHHLLYFREHGVLRQSPLKPTSQPFEALAAVVDSLHAAYRNNDEPHENFHGRWFLGAQLLRLIDTAYRTSANGYQELWPDREVIESELETIPAKVAAHGIRWDAERSAYTRADGSTLPAIERKSYRRTIWRPDVSGLDAQIVLERVNEDFVDVIFEERVNARAEESPCEFLIRSTAQDGPQLARFESHGRLVENGPYHDDPFEFSYGAQHQRVTLKAGRELQVDFSWHDRRQSSPLLKP